MPYQVTKLLRPIRLGGKEPLYVLVGVMGSQGPHQVKPSTTHLHPEPGDLATLIPTKVHPEEALVLWGIKVLQAACLEFALPHLGHQFLEKAWQVSHLHRSTEAGKL